MAGEWTDLRLGDVIEVRHGWPFKSQEFSDDLSGRPIVVNIGNFRYTGGFRFESTTVREYRGTYPREYELIAGEILLVMTCQTAGGEILGIPARVPEDGRTYLHNQRLGRVLVKNHSVDKDYLYWLFLSPSFNRELCLTASGTKILHTAPTRIEAVRVRLPSLREQRAIAHFLGALDEKIELNRRMNETLEAIARALFKSWFVDYDPVRAKAERRPSTSSGQAPPLLPKHIAELFPDRFVDSELGEIPAGWVVKNLGDLFSLDKGLSYKGRHLNSGGILMVNLGCFLGRGRFKEAALKAYSGEFQSRHTVREGDLVLANTDITQKREVLGSPGLIPPTRCGEAIIFTHHIFAARFHKGLESWKTFAFHSLLLDEFRARASGFATGTTVLALPRDAVLDFQFAAPPTAILNVFKEIARQLLRRQWNGESESRALAALRDMLLPKLISGELRIKRAEKLAEYT